MRSFTTSIALAAAFASATAAATVENRETAGADLPSGVIHASIQKQPSSDITQRIRQDRQRLAKRQSGSTVEVDLANDFTLYFMNITIGTPEQSLSMHIDTGSSDLWVNVATSTFCEDASNMCSDTGYYYPNRSSTYQYVNSRFDIQYEDGSQALGDYVTDTVRFGGISLQNQQFGIGYKSSSAEGVLGIGYTTNEVSEEYSGTSYANIPANLAQQGIINTNAYSLWLNDLEANEGSILFGGVNTDKYSGSLQTLPIIPTQGIYAEFNIALTAVGANGTVGSLANNLDYAALLDSGTSLMYLPDSIAKSVWSSVGGVYNQRAGLAIVSCNIANTDATIDFTFSGATIRVGLDELTFEVGTRGGQPVCGLGVLSAGNSPTVLGDTFLRSAYVVYDLHNNQISIGQTQFNGTTNNIKAITTSGVPGASLVSNPVSTASNAASGQGSIGGNPSGTLSAAAPAIPVPSFAGYNMAMVGAVAGGLIMAAM